MTNKSILFWVFRETGKTFFSPVCILSVKKLIWLWGDNNDHMTVLSNFFPKRIETSFTCFWCSRRALKMCGNVAFLAVLIWFFSAESQSDAFPSIITRDYLDTFTNGVCGPCSNYEATPSRNSSGSCTCSGSLKCLTDANLHRGSVFVRSKGKCESSCNLTSMCCFKFVIVILVKKTLIAKSGKKLVSK